MSKIELSLPAAAALYSMSEKVKRGEVDAGDLRDAYLELGVQLEKICSVVSDWAPGRSNNQFISNIGWMVSYKIASDSGEPETALIDRNTGTYYVLAGDHRDAFKRVASQGWAALKQVYDSLENEFPHGS